MQIYFKQTILQINFQTSPLPHERSTILLEYEREVELLP